MYQILFIKLQIIFGVESDNLKSQILDFPNDSLISFFGTYFFHDTYRCVFQPSFSAISLCSHHQCKHLNQPSLI